MIIERHVVSSTGIVHEVVQVSKEGQTTYFTTACHQNDFNPDDNVHNWKKVNAAVTCKHCLNGKVDKPIRNRLYRGVYETPDGVKMRHIIAQNRAEAVLKLMVIHKIKNTPPNIDVTEV